MVHMIFSRLGPSGLFKYLAMEELGKRRQRGEAPHEEDIEFLDVPTLVEFEAQAVSC